MAETPSAKPMIAPITGLRFVAALYVVLYHYSTVISWPSALNEVIRHGAAGVSLFYVLSGFVLTYNYGNGFQTSLSGVRAFFQARFARVIPMYVVALLIGTVIVALLPSLREAYSVKALIASWLANLFLVQVYLPRAVMAIWNAPSWSVADEFAFYLVFPLLMRGIFRRLSSARALLAAAGGIALAECLLVTVIYRAGAVLISHGYPAGDVNLWVYVMVYYWPFLRLSEFALGCAAGCLFLNSRTRETRESIVAWLGKPAVRNMLIAVVGMAFILVCWRIAGRDAVPSAYLAYEPLAALLVTALAFGPTFLGRLLSHPVMVRLGEASYSLYILHFLVLTVFAHLALLHPYIPTRLHLGLGFLAAVTSIILTIALSLGTHRLIEVPARQMLRPRHPERARTEGSTPGSLAGSVRPL